MRHHAGRFAAAVCSTLLAVGCGQSAAPTTVRVVPAAVRVAPLTAAQAKAVARAGVLTASDFPGYSAQRGTAPSAADRVEDAQVYRCAGGKAPTYSYRNFGNEFSKPGTFISSSVDVLPSAKAVTADLNLFESARTQRCLERVIRQGAKKQGWQVTALETTAVHPLVPGTPRLVALAFDLHLLVRGRPGEVVVIQQVAQSGQAEIGLMMTLTGLSTATLIDGSLFLTSAVARANEAGGLTDA